MMGCSESKSSGCIACKIMKHPDQMSTDSSYSYSATDAEVVNIRKKSSTDGRFMRMLSPRHLFKGWRRNENISMLKVERYMKAAILIQKWYRRYLARMEVTRRYTWNIFQSLEYAGEQDQVKLYNFFNALLTHIPDMATKISESRIISKTPSIDLMDVRYEDESDELEERVQYIDGEYTGIHINFPLCRSDLDLLIDTFRQKKPQRLHARYVAGILIASATILRRLPNLNQVSTAITKQVTICGDLHGKLDDLLIIFHKNGLPSPENPYVFNGDFVDRGKKGLEVFLLLLSCMLVFPGGIFLNRGNHEDHIMNARYGFIREVHQKYKTNANKLLKLIEGVYRWLPLGTIVNNKVFIVHGGISDSTDLEMIKSLDRGKYISLLRPPTTESTAPGADIIDKAEWKQIFDILWSDPQPADGCTANSLRGAGTYFGPDITNNFLKKNKFIYLIRSHECKPDGYEIIHNNKVITIFSASNYYELGSNKGAYVKLVGPQLVPHFVQFTSALSKMKRLTFRQRIGLVELAAIRELSGQIISSKKELMAEFKKSDQQYTGLITISEWCRAMEIGTALSLPWRMLRDKLVVIDGSTKKVIYKTTFHGNGVVITPQNNSTTVVEALYRNNTSLEAIFRIIDKDNSGYISLQEFSDACSLLRQHMPNPITQQQLMEICRLMDINKDGLVDLNEFLETFRLVDMEQQQNINSQVKYDDISCV